MKNLDSRENWGAVNATIKAGARTADIAVAGEKSISTDEMTQYVLDNIKA